MRTNFFPLLLILFLLSPATAQTTTTTVVLGVVRDQQQNVVVAASVTLIEVATNHEFVTVTDAEGRYSFYALKPGKYEVKIVAPGFKTAEVHEVRAELSKVAMINVSLELGEILLVQTVVAGTESQLQATDASVGVVFSAETLKRLPNATRQAESLFNLAPATTVDGEFAGARREQSTITLDGIDVSDNATGQLRTVIPVTVESIKEMRSTVVNPNATFIPSSGGHIVLVTKSGTNELHGSSYLYHQNVALTANSWTNNRVGIARPFSLDNRFGGTIGGPIRAEKSFYFFNYEGRRNPRSQTVTRIVPTESYRTGEMRRVQASGAIDSVQVAINPVIKEYLSLYPLPNDFTQGDHLNTAGFTFAPSVKATSDFGVVRLDQKFGQNWNADLKLAVFRLLNTDARQVDLQKRVATAGSPQRAGNTVFALTGAFTPHLANETRFSWLRDRLNRVDAVQPQAFFGLNVAIDLAENHLDELVDLDYARAQGFLRSLNLYQWSDALTWIKGRHTLQLGGNLRRIQENSQTNLKGLPTPVATVSVDPVNPYRNCASGNQYGALCGALTGSVSSVSVLVTRDANLRIQPYGKGVPTRASLSEYAFFLTDTWRWRQNLTLSWGLSYSWQRPPVEASGLQTLLTYKDSGQLIGYEQFIRDKRQAAQEGRVHNPLIAFVPIKQTGRSSAYDTDYTNFSPRFSLAWNPSFKSGWLKWFLGNGKSVIRGGYGVVYDRTNTIQTINLPTLGIGFSKVETLSLISNPSLTLDKQKPIPLPDVPLVISSPIVPRIRNWDNPLVDERSFTIDPYIKVPRNHTVDVTIQRELPGRLFLEVGYIGRLARGLYVNGNLNAVPFMHRDAQSGQILSEVFDGINLVEGGLSQQPYFKNQYSSDPPETLKFWVSNFEKRAGVDRSLGFAQFGLDLAVASGFLRGPTLTNQQVDDLLVRASVACSNYHAGFISLRKQYSSSLVFDLSYTLSQSLDNAGAISSQGNLAQLQSVFNPDIDYGPSQFDLRHLFKASSVYQFPLRLSSRTTLLKKVAGGWYTAGIFTGQSGLPLTFLQYSNAFGGGYTAEDFGGGYSGGTGLLPLSHSLFDKGVHRNVTPPPNPNSSDNATNQGSGLNLFADPAQVIASFRRVRVSQDGRHGRGALRGLRRWNFDWTIGKETKLSEKAKFTFSVDFLNPFNQVIFNDPDLRESNLVNFGVLSSQYNTPRRIQIGARIDF